MNPIAVFYRPEMVAANAASFSPSAAKPGKVVEDWLACGLPIDALTFEPASESTLALAHDPAYVRGVLSLEIDNGFGNRDAGVARSLPYTSGSMIAAAQYVLCGAGRVACSPTSGFHHAHYAHGRGFCTFNGLVIAALHLKRKGLLERLGILDYDYHFGDGTTDIIDRLGLDWITHVTAGARYGRPSQAQAFLASIEPAIRSMRDAGCDVVLYQAGADQHVNDPLGGVVTTDQMLERDRAVFRLCREAGLRMVWNLAGGYQREPGGGIGPVLALHRNTMTALIEDLQDGA